MLLAIDVGNTVIALGLSDGERLVASWRLATRSDATADQVAVQVDQLFRLSEIDREAVTEVVIGCVVPSLSAAFVETSVRHLRCQPLLVGPGTRTGVRIRNENPKEVGPDRIANALAAYRRYGGPAVVIDFSTAITYDAISADGDYLGCAIAPGLEVSLDALVASAARLQRVEPAAPAAVIGRTTAASIQAGLVWGVVSQVEGMVQRMAAELGGEVKVIATGAHADLVAGLTEVVDSVDPLLTLEGLRLIHALNAPAPEGR